MPKTKQFHAADMISGFHWNPTFAETDTLEVISEYFELESVAEDTVKSLHALALTLQMRDRHPDRTLEAAIPLAEKLERSVDTSLDLLNTLLMNHMFMSLIDETRHNQIEVREAEHRLNELQDALLEGLEQARKTVDRTKTGGKRKDSEKQNFVHYLRRIFSQLSVAEHRTINSRVDNEADFIQSMLELARPDTPYSIATIRGWLAKAE